MKKAAFIILFFIVFGFSLTLSSVISAPSVPGKYDFSQEQMYIEQALNMNENIEIQPIHDKNLENKVKDYIKKVHKVIAHMQRNRQTMIRVFSLLIVVLFMLLSCVFYYSFYLKRRSIKPVVKKYEQSTLTVQKADQHLNRLLRYMEEEKPYLEFELTLRDIARQLSIPQKELSQVINERLNKNFCTFINEYRIQEARRLLLGNSGKTLSVLDIAYESGFNSKTSFNMVFKKHLQMTPTHFRKIYHPAARGTRGNVNLPEG